MKRWMVYLNILFFAALIGCGEAPTDEGAERGTWQASKADDGATCQDHCGVAGPTQEGCFCDETCVQFGDCCPDFQQLCTDTEPAPTCGVSCQTQADCPANEPYCDVDTGTCQRTAPECVSDDDCSDTAPFCQRSGYCSIWPDFNCRAGDSVFEGECDNAACDQAVCPEGTLMNENECVCEPTTSAPSCQSQRDCNAAFPYCNVDTGTCQQTAPECVGDDDCSEDAPFCQGSGYCSIWPDLNCAAGDVVFEGECDNPACDQAACPEDTLLDEDTCVCEPVCG